MDELLLSIAITAGIVVAALGAIIGGQAAYAVLIDKPACTEYGRISQRPTMFSLGTNCLVQRDGEWIEYKVAVGHKQEITVKAK